MRHTPRPWIVAGNLILLELFERHIPLDTLNDLEKKRAEIKILVGGDQ